MSKYLITPYIHSNSAQTSCLEVTRSQTSISSICLSGLVSRHFNLASAECLKPLHRHLLGGKSDQVPPLHPNSHLKAFEWAGPPSPLQSAWFMCCLWFYRTRNNSFSPEKELGINLEKAPEHFFKTPIICCSHLKAAVDISPRRKAFNPAWRAQL